MSMTIETPLSGISAQTELADRTPVNLLARLFRDEPLFTAAGLFVAMMMVPTLAAMALDDRLFNGVNVWDKPFKFEFALSVWLLTLAFYSRFLPDGMTARRWYRVFSAIVVFCIAGELAWIGGAAANGTASHFNVANPVMGSIYGLMGAFAVILTSSALVYGLAIRSNAYSGLSPAMKQAIWTSLAATFVLTVIVAGTLSSMDGHWIGGTRSDAGGGFFFDWSRDGGDLRVAHFFATHAMHIVPAAAFLTQRAGGRLTPWAAVLMTLAYAGFVLAVYGQALMGKPFLPGLI